MRYPIEKNSIQETLVIPLYGRALCSRKFPHLFADQTAAELLEQIDYDVSALEQRSGGLMQTFGALEAAMRQSDLAFEVREYLRAHPRAAVVNLGCGLDSTGRSCDNGQCRIYNIDLPDVMVVREALLPAEEREKNLAADLNDFSWFRPERLLLVRCHRHAGRGRGGVLCRRRVLLLPDGAGALPLRGHGGAVPGRAAGI